MLKFFKLELACDSVKPVNAPVFSPSSIKLLLGTRIKTVFGIKSVYVKREQVKTRGSEFLEDGVYVLEKSVVRGDYQSVTRQATRVQNRSNEQQINNSAKREVSALLKKVHLASQIQEEWSL